MIDIQNLVQRIQQSNLSDSDKAELITHLQKETPDINQFLQTFFDILKIGKECLKLFDIDTGE